MTPKRFREAAEIIGVLTCAADKNSICNSEVPAVQVSSFSTGAGIIAVTGVRPEVLESGAVSRIMKHCSRIEISNVGGGRLSVAFLMKDMLIYL